MCRVVRTEDMSQPGPSLITVMAPLGASTSQTPADTCRMLMSLHCLWATCLLCLSIINIDNTQANPIITDDDFLRYKRTNMQHIYTYIYTYLSCSICNMVQIYLLLLFFDFSSWALLMEQINKHIFFTVKFSKQSYIIYLCKVPKLKKLS